MATNVTMPKLGLTMETGKIVEWKKAEGEEVKQGEILLIVETEKITYEVESPGTGILHIIVPQDAEVPVAELIGVIAADKAEYDKVAAGAAPAAAAPAAEAMAAAAPVTASANPGPQQAQALVRTPGERMKSSPLARKLALEAEIDISLVPGTGPEGRVVKKDVLTYQEASHIRITPVAEKIAREHKLEPSQIAGTGPAGKITKEDVMSFIEKQKAPAAAAAGPGEGDRLVKLTGMRKVIARKMLQSCNEAAMTYMANNIDATVIQNFRKEFLPIAEKKHGVRVTITDIGMKITAAAIRQHPVINTRWTDQGILWLQDIHMGMAMALKDGLIVPVIRNCDKKSIIEIAKERVSLIEKGRSGKLLPDEITGSTFTYSVMGMFGTEFFTAIINQPENAILGVGAIIDKPVVVDKQIVIRPVMNICLTYDHRTIDGVEAGRFLRTLTQFMENPMLIYET
jgi:pyruvate dehydrogenase E2 component (dihydrolipoamide acetyltransferase)